MEKENKNKTKKNPPLPCILAMNGRNQSLVTYELVEFKKEPFEVQGFCENY